MLEATDEIRNAVLAGAGETVISDMARKNGMLTLKEDAIIKAMKKLIPYEEIAQVGGLMNLADAEDPEEEAEASIDLDEDVESSPRTPVADQSRDLV
jgi:hypothetical protein